MMYPEIPIINLQTGEYDNGVLTHIYTVTTQAIEPEIFKVIVTTELLSGFTQIVKITTLVTGDPVSDITREYISNCVNSFHVEQIRHDKDELFENVIIGILNLLLTSDLNLNQSCELVLNAYFQTVGGRATNLLLNHLSNCMNADPDEIIHKGIAKVRPAYLKTLIEKVRDFAMDKINRNA